MMKPLKNHKIHSGKKGGMATMGSEESALQLSPFYKVTDTSSKRDSRNRFFSYRFGLVIFDLIMVQLAFGLGGLAVDSSFYLRGNLNQPLLLFVLSLVVLAFFPAFDLYSYHVIFLRKKHLANQIKSFGWSLLTFGIVTSILIWPQLFTSYYSISIIFLAAVVMMLASRFFWGQLLYVIESIGIGFLIVGMIGLITPDNSAAEIINWRVIPVGFLFAVVLLLANRYFIVHVVYNTWLRRNFRRQVAIVGSDENAKSIATHIIDRNAPYWVAGIVGESGLDISVSKKRLGPLEGLPDIVEQNRIDEIIVTDEKIEKRTLISLLDYCTTEKITVWFPPKLMPIVDMKLYIDNFCGLKMIRLCSQKNPWLFNKLKHGMDALIALPAFVILSPLFLIISLAIKLNSKGPVFYRALAVGKNGEKFNMFKFRSMRTDINSDIHKEYVTRLIKGEISNGGNEDQPLKITDDPRITPVGKFLRKFSLDELPQLINVLKGNMSLVGPRPCLPYEYAVYKEWHKKRTSVRPGITGLWQVAGRSEVLFEDMILLDLYYIYNRGFALDFSILNETVFVVLGKRGAY
jgi:undecaprenyl-phosphate galactose phosphotransferase